jgi:Leucine-rich repeat (LRR) protein
MTLVTFLCAATASAANVTFPDPNLEAAIRLAINQPTGPISDAALLGLTSLNASFRNIADLTGLDHCGNLTQLQLHGNRIVDLGPLASLSKLADLYLWENQISDILPLEGLTRLRFVFLYNNQIEDISALGANPGLGPGDVVNLSGNPLNQEALCTTIPDLQQRGVTVYFSGACGKVVVHFADENLELQVRKAKGVRKLTGTLFDTDLSSPAFTELDAPNAGIVDLRGLEYCTNLTTVDFTGNRIADIGTLGQLGRITMLYLGGNQISDLRPLTQSYGLLYLEVQDQHRDDGTKTLSDPDGIQSLGGLMALYAHDNQITDISKLKWLLNLRELALGRNQISDISVIENLGALVMLALEGNQISNIGALADLTSLQALSLADQHVFDAKGNRVPVLSNISKLANLTGLLSLDLSFNKIGDISVLTGLTKLMGLYLHNNRLTGTGAVAGLPDLAVLTLQNNNINDISPLVANPGLGRTPPYQLGPDRVDVRGNQLSLESLCHDIPALQQRNVVIRFDGYCCEISYALTTAVRGSGSIDPQGTRRFCEGAKIVITATAAPGWVFDHWEGDLSGPENPATVTMDKDKRITAVFGDASATFTLTTSVDGQGTVDPPAGPHAFSSGSLVTVSATPVAGWVFDHWSGDLQGHENPDNITMDGDKSVKAVFVRERPKYTLTTAVKGQGTIDPPAGTHPNIAESTAIVVKATAELGYVFDHWEGDLAGSANPNTIVMTGNKTVTAVFKADGFDFTLAMVLNGNGITTPTPGFHRYKNGAEVTVRAAPGTGWVFDHWSGDLYGEQTPAILVMDKNKTVTAVFLYAPVTYTLTTAVRGGGSVSPAPGVRAYPDGKTVTLAATADPGSVFDRWEGDVGGTATVTLITMNANKSATAVFRKYPVISAVSPDRGATAGSDPVTIFGLELATTTSVTFGDAAATIVSASDTLVNVITPPHARGAVDVIVTTALGTVTQAAGFVFIEPPGPPELGSVTPNRGSALGGDPVVIRGRNLQITQAVYFGGIPGLVVASEETRVAAVAPPHMPGTVEVALTTSTGTATLQNAYTYVIRPQILTVYPNQGSAAGGDTVRIFGFGLANPSSVTFGDAAATVVSSSDMEIDVITPAHAGGTVSISVATPGGIGTAADAFNFFTGAATIACYVLDEPTQKPVVNASIRLEPLGRTITQNENGVYTFANIRPDKYLIIVSAPSYAIALRTISVQRDEHATLTFLLKPALGPVSACGLDIKRLDEKIAEAAMPLSVEESPFHTTPRSSTLAIRLSAAQPVDPASVWAVLETGDWSVSGGTWRATAPGDDRDGWVTFTANDGLPASAIITMTVGAVTTDGTILGPMSQDFLVSADKEAASGGPTLREDPDVASLPGVVAAAKSPVYRIGPAQVFAQPVTIQIPVAPGSNPDDLEVYYYSESAAHIGWHRGENVVGWMAPAARRTVEADGQTYVEIQVNHAGVVQLGRALKLTLGGAGPVEFGFSGSRILWVSLCGTLLGLSVALGKLVWGRRRP